MDSMKPLIEAFYDNCRIEQENHVMKAVADIGIVVDKERLTKALTDAKAFYEEGYEAGRRAAQRQHGKPNPHIVQYCGSGGKVVAEHQEGWECPFCGEAGVKNYCPECGAKMDVTDINVGNKTEG